MIKDALTTRGVRDFHCERLTNLALRLHRLAFKATSIAFIASLVFEIVVVTLDER